jgi:hypothetical protein
LCEAEEYCIKAAKGRTCQKKEKAMEVRVQSSNFQQQDLMKIIDCDIS